MWFFMKNISHRLKHLNTPHCVERLCEEQLCWREHILGGGGGFKSSALSPLLVLADLLVLNSHHHAYHSAGSSLSLGYLGSSEGATPLSSRCTRSPNLTGQHSGLNVF